MNDDRKIIERVLAGESDAYRSLVEKYERSVFGFLKGLLRNPSDIEDLAQEVFVAAFRHLASFDVRRAKFSTWLLTIAHNRCCNHLKRRPSVSSESTEPTCNRPQPDVVVANREFWQRLDEALDQLPIEQRTAFVLAEIQGVPYAEVAIIERIAIGTVKSRVSRAKDRLRLVLKSLQPESVTTRGSESPGSHR